MRTTNISIAYIQDEQCVERSFCVLLKTVVKTVIIQYTHSNQPGHWPSEDPTDPIFFNCMSLLLM